MTTRKRTERHISKLPSIEKVFNLIKELNYPCIIDGALFKSGLINLKFEAKIYASLQLNKEVIKITDDASSFFIENNIKIGQLNEIMKELKTFNSLIDNYEEQIMKHENFLIMDDKIFYSHSYLCLNPSDVGWRKFAQT